MDTYEKKYKEAQKWIESIYPNLSHEQQMEAEAFFPELAESEDEKIRKEIISFIKDDINEINLKMSGDYDDRDEDDIAHQNWCKKAISWLENIPYTIDHEKREGFHLGYKAGLEKQGEQKPAWSEEDERMCQETIDWFEKKCFPYALENENPARESIKWLKSLKDKYTWKPSIAQLNALSIVSKGNAPDDIEAIVSLYNDLKKLTEE